MDNAGEDGTDAAETTGAGSGPPIGGARTGDPVETRGSGETSRKAAPRASKSKGPATKAERKAAKVRKGVAKEERKAAKARKATAKSERKALEKAIKRIAKIDRKAAKEAAQLGRADALIAGDGEAEPDEDVGVSAPAESVPPWRSAGPSPHAVTPPNPKPQRRGISLPGPLPRSTGRARRASPSSSAVRPISG